ncbi:membrane protein DedA with SNARE-associated domain [Scopulibacillus daqui]|uniref:Membrane protein DedA with SNARE-associated domain n=1 Tax=Scopulibacillus daqui TaxID=1469162 RepID=A0ABS2PX58_9BACL|nr:DedA family protein [Scopulibacillus daqui]MBM7644145.1 membrane protein DedA with SNARE-associated domain [Scopulibacillus daqui]
MLHQMIEWLRIIATGLITTFGHWGIFIGMAIESACIPLPSEVILLFGGFLAAQGKLTFGLVVLAGVLGNVAGSVLTFWIGKKGGRSLLEKYGRYVLINQRHLDIADQWFSKYGDWAAFFGRMLPVIRTFISLPAGIAQMNVKRFLTFTLLGCIPWNIIITFLGWKLGQHWEAAQQYLKPLSYIAVLLVAVFLARLVYKMVRKKQVELSSKDN